MNSLNSEIVPTPTEVPKPLPDPAGMAPQLRLQYIEGYRLRKMKGENLTIDELRHAIACISADRAAAQRERSKGNAAAKTITRAPSLDDL